MQDFASLQLSTYKKYLSTRSTRDIGAETTAHGAPVKNSSLVLTVGDKGPMLLEDFRFQQSLAHFVRERIPERTLHAKGAGAFGTFTVTNDITKYCCAKVFSMVGKTTPVAVRFSTVIGESGSADTVRDLRGFAVKFYTEEGIWDLVGNNTPTFFLREPGYFPHLLHAGKRNPQTHLHDYNSFWDFITLRPETMHQLMFHFSDRGIPLSYRHMNGYGSNTYIMVNKKKGEVFIKFHYKPVEGIRNLDPVTAAQLASSDPDYFIRDLFNAIENGNFPSWILSIQVMTYDQASKQTFDPLDITKTWPHKDFPLIEVGKFTLNMNPKNYFMDIENLAFTPANMPPGIAASADKILQARLFVYSSAHDYRLGCNSQHLPVNRPFRVNNHYRDGAGCFFNGENAPNYLPNSYGYHEEYDGVITTPFDVQGTVDRYESNNGRGNDNYSQARDFWDRVLDESARSRLCNVIAQSLRPVDEHVKQRALGHFNLVHPVMGKTIENILNTKKLSG